METSSSLTTNSCQTHIYSRLLEPGWCGNPLPSHLAGSSCVGKCVSSKPSNTASPLRGQQGLRWEAGAVTDAPDVQKLIHPHPWELEQKENPGGTGILSWWRTRINTNRIDSGPVDARGRGGISGGSTQWPLLWVSNTGMSREARRMIPCGSGLWQSASWNSDFALTPLSDGSNKSQMGELIRPFPWPGPL